LAQSSPFRGANGDDRIVAFRSAKGRRSGRANMGSPELNVFQATAREKLERERSEILKNVVKLRQNAASTSRVILRRKAL
jgi:hypothetical protein